MEFTINSVGNANFLEQILIAVAMVTGSGSFEKMAAIGLLMGILMMAVQSLFEGAKQINFHQIFLAWILYAVMFGPTATVLIEDNYSADVRVVDNIPIGVAASGGMISQVGYGLTRMMDLSFQILGAGGSLGGGYYDYGLTQTYFADALKFLNGLRGVGLDSNVLDSMNTAVGPNTDLRQSWTNYFKECTAAKIDRGDINIDEFMLTNFSEAARLVDPNLGTRIIVNGSKDLLCGPAFDQLHASTTSALTSPLVNSALRKSVLGKDAEDDVSTSGFLNRTGNAMNMLGQVSTDAQGFVVASIVRPVYLEAMAGKYKDLRDISSAMMVNQAIQQRNTQWASEQTMFMTTARPMMTFIEGFVYAVTPLLAFIILMGAFGMKLAVKYMQMLLWIQLWMPVLAIVNLYIYMSATGEMVAYAFDPTQVTSFYALDRTFDTMQNWVSTGGMLAAATPILTLVLITGSTYALTSLTGRMQSGESINEKIQSPDTVNPGAVLDQTAAYSQDPTSGLGQTGIDKTLGSLKLGSMLNGSKQSAQADAHTKSQLFASNLSNTLSSGVSDENTYNRAATFGHMIQSSSGEGVEAVQNAVASATRNSGLSDTDAQSVGSLLAASAAGGVKLPGLVEAGLPAELGARLQVAAESKGQTVSQYMSGLQEKMDQSLNLSEKDTAQLQETIADGINASSGQAFKSTLSQQESQTLSNSAADSVQASRTYQEIESQANTYGVGHDIQNRALANSLVNENGGVGARYLRDLKLSGSDQFRAEATHNTEQLEAKGVPPEQAEALGTVEALSNTGAYGFKGIGDIAQAYSMATGRAANTMPDGTQNSDLTGSSAHDVDLSGQRLNGPKAVDRGAVEGQVNADPRDDTAVNNFDASGSPAQDDYSNNSSGVVRTSAERAQQDFSQKLPDLTSRLQNTSNDPSIGHQTMAMIDTAGYAMQGAAKLGAELAGSAAGGIDQVVQAAGGLSSEEAKEIHNGIQSGTMSEAEVQQRLGGASNGVSMGLVGAALGGVVGEVNGSQNMTNSQRGAYLLGLATNASQEHAAAAHSTVQGAQDEARQNAVNRGLSPAQVDLYSEGYGAAGSVDKLLNFSPLQGSVNAAMGAAGVGTSEEDYVEQRMDEYIDAGLPWRGEQNREELEELAKAEYKNITTATRAGDQGTAHLTGLSAVNVEIEKVSALRGTMGQGQVE